MDYELWRRCIVAGRSRLSLANLTLLVGLASVLFIWLPGPPVRPDQFTLPKDVALGILGLVCSIVLVIHGDITWEPLIDSPLLAALFWGALLTPIVAINTPLAWRAIGGFSAALSLFLLARRVGSEVGSEWFYLAICYTLAVFAGLVLLEAFGGIPFISEPGRRPGATLGNRNLAARLMCLGLPLIWREMVISNQKWTRGHLTGIVAITTAVIVLSRSRGVWLIAVGLVICLPAISFLMADSRAVARLRTSAGWWAVAVISGTMLAIFLPNRMGWSPGDFVSSADRALDYQTGTGRGRVVQVLTTWRMIQAAPMHGVGPGNWSVVYPAFARVGDPSYTPDGLYPAPRIPRGDILSLTAEFGLPVLAFALASGFALLVRARSMLRSADLREKYAGLVILTMGTAAALLGLVDPVLRLSPTLALIATITGVSLSITPRPTPRKYTSERWRMGGQGVVVAFGAASLFLGSQAFRDITVLSTIRSMTTINDLYRAVGFAPNNLEARASLAYVLISADRCDLAAPHLTHASRLHPFSGAVLRLRARCAKRQGQP